MSASSGAFLHLCVCAEAGRGANFSWSGYLSQSGMVARSSGVYYHISQGSSVMPYDIFLNLEAADSQELFRSDANSERYGLTPDPANPQWNPDGLP